MTTSHTRFTVTATGGVRTVNGIRCRYAVIDRHKRLARVSWHPTFRRAQDTARTLNQTTTN